MTRLAIVFSLAIFSIACKSKNDFNKVSVNENKFKLGIDEITLTSLSSDTNEIHIEYSKSSHDYSMYFFKSIPDISIKDSIKIKALFIELKQSENRNTPTKFIDLLKAVYYTSYSFEINSNDWNAIKTQVKSIVSNIDESRQNYYCEFCDSYTLAYNNDLIEDKLLKNNLVKNLYNFVDLKYRNKLYSIRKLKE